MSAELDRAMPEWFQGYCDRVAVRKHPTKNGGKYPCPCCRARTLEERGAYEICTECGWEDDGQDDATADERWPGPNRCLTLTEARERVKQLGDIFLPDDPRHPWRDRMHRDGRAPADPAESA